MCIAEHHNFFVSKAHICVHNFAPLFVLGISLVFGSGAMEIAGFSFGLAGLGTYLAYQWHKNNKQNAMGIGVISFGGGMMPNEPEDENEKKRKRDNQREDYQSLTNKEARGLAKKLKFKEDKSPPFDSHGDLTFKKGNIYISPDNTGHRGGVWKMFTRKGVRIRTWNSSLTEIIGN